MQPNRSPTTGSSRLPSRSSTFATPFRARLKAANASARAFTSVATTCAGVAGEQERLDPVPGADVERALDRLPDRQVRERGGRPVDARDAVRSLDVEPVGCDQEVVVRDDAHEPAQRAVASLGEPASTSSSASSPGGTGVAEQQERDQHREAVGLGREPAPVHLEVDVREDRLAARVQAPRDPGAGVPGGREHLPQPRRACRRAGGEGGRLQILTFFVRSQPPCTGASSEPSAFCGA